MSQEIFHGCHNGSDTGFVICSQEGGTIGEQDVLSLIAEYFRKIFRRKDNVLLFVQDDVFSIIIFHQYRFHRAARSVRSRIHMGNETDHRAFFTAIGRQGGHYIAMFIQGHVAEPQCFQFFRQMFRQHQLIGRTGRSLAVGFAGLGVERNIIFKTMEQFLL